MTLLELINRIKVVAIETSALEIRPALLDNEILIEVLLPRCMNVVSDKVARTPDGLSALRSSVTVTFTAGSGPFPGELKQEYVDTIAFKDDPLASYVPNFNEFQLSGQPADCSKFTVYDQTIYYNQLGQAPGTFTGNRVIIALMRQTLPPALTDTVELAPHVLNQLIAFTATVVNGQVPLSRLGLDYSSLERVRAEAI